MNRKILQLAIPSIVSNITVPLLGLVDVAIVGHLGSASYIGAIAVGGMLFNMIYWIFGFLRMGTSGMTAQAYGKRGLDGGSPDLAAGCRGRAFDLPRAFDPSIPDPEGCVCFDRRNGGGKTMGLSLF